MFSFNGKYTQLRYVNIWPRPMQKPRPPVWVPGGASVETWDLCLDNDFLYANLSYFGYQEGQKVLDGFWNAVDRTSCRAIPIAPASCSSSPSPTDDAEAERLYAEPALYFYRRCLHVYARLRAIRRATCRWRRSRPASRARSSRITNRAGARAEMATLSWKDLVERGYLVAGSPATVADRINDMADKLNVGHLMTLLHFGNMSKEVTTVQHADVRGAGHAAAALALQRMGGQLVSRATCRCRRPRRAGRLTPEAV